MFFLRICNFKDVLRINWIRILLIEQRCATFKTDMKKKNSITHSRITVITHFVFNDLCAIITKNLIVILSLHSPVRMIHITATAVVNAHWFPVSPMIRTRGRNKEMYLMEAIVTKYQNFMKYFHKTVTPPPRTAFMKSLFRFPH